MSETTTVWCIILDHKQEALARPFKVEVPSDSDVQDLKDIIRVRDMEVLGDIPAHHLKAWRSHKQLKNIRGSALPQFTSELFLPEDESESVDVKPTANEDLISDLGPFLNGYLHFIVQKPAPGVNASKVWAHNYPRAIAMRHPDPNHNVVDFIATHLLYNHVESVQSSEHFEKFRILLQRKRYLNRPGLSSGLLSSLSQLFPQNGSNDHFQSDPPLDAPLDHVTPNELVHYVDIFHNSELSKAAIFRNDKEHHIFALLLKFVGILASPLYNYGFGKDFPFYLVVEKPEESFMYTPRPDFHMRIRDFPHILLEIVSRKNESDRWRMLLQASCLARLSNRVKSKDKESIVIMAIYVNKDFVASRYLVSAATPDENSVVQYVTDTFDLANREEAFEFVFQLYNFISAAKIDSDKIDDPNLALNLKQLVVGLGLKHFVATVSKPRGTGTNVPGSSHTGPSHAGPSGVAHDSFELVQQDLMAAGYMFPEIPKGFVRLTPLKYTLRRAISRSGSSVALKMTHGSHELEMLRYLGEIKTRSNHTIPLLDVIRLSIDKTIIVLPWKSPLDEVLQLGTRADAVESLCIQFIEGVSFLHQQHVAHCDLKPDNVVIDTKLESSTSPRLFIIDFDIAQFVESEAVMVEGWRGTQTWTAPDLGSIDGPTQQYNPILADRWACGMMIEYFVRYTPTQVNTRHLLEFAQRLLSINPAARPPLSQLLDRPAKRRLAVGQDEPV